MTNRGMTYKDVVSHAIENNSQAIKELRAQADVTADKVNIMLLNNLVSIISALALCVAEITDTMNAEKEKRG